MISTSLPMTSATLPLGPVIVDVEGFSLTATEIDRLQHPLVGGVILFARNFDSKKQVTQLCAQIHAVRSPRLLICVDHEGGRVQRFKKGFTAIPPMRELGIQWDKDVLGATKRATELGQIIGKELVDIGVDLSFTPVLDLDYTHSQVIGDRAFHSDARVVTLLAKSLNHGLLLSKMGNCGKHFPGHGYAGADSHYDLPVDDRSLKELLSADAAPYDWLGDSLLSVMPAHVLYPKVDDMPAGFSKVWLKKILRKQLKFDGVIFSDDLIMEAAAAYGSITERANAAFDAGCDSVLVCNRPDLADELLANLRYKGNKDFARRFGKLFR
jgi:beta-N-acetylhexosaminidase